MSQIFWFLYVYTTYVSQLRKFRVNIFTVMLTSWKITKFLLCPLGTIYKQLISYCLQVRRVEKIFVVSILRGDHYGNGY